MPKLKDLLPGFFSKDTPKVLASDKNVGKLEFDALPMHDDQNNEDQATPSNTPTVSTELTESVVRELTDPNYNSLVSTRDAAGALVANGHSSADGGILAPTMNTMNVHNAQQQVVMQFSNVNKLHIGSVYNFNSNRTASSDNSSRKNSNSIDETNIASTSAADTGKPTQQRQMLRKTTTVVAMMRDPDEPNHRMLDTIATHLGEGWKQLMRDLGHSEGQIDQALIDHQLHGGIKEVIYQLLLQWVRNADDGAATVGFITTLLWESHHRDCVNRMKQIWKSDSVQKKI